jgi:hypothetical protein
MVSCIWVQIEEAVALTPQKGPLIAHIFEVRCRGSPILIWRTTPWRRLHLSSGLVYERVLPQLCQNVILSRHFRLQVLEVLVRVHMAIPDPEYVTICQALQFLNRAADVAAILDELVRGPEGKALLAYQVRRTRTRTWCRCPVGLRRGAGRAGGV